jgi:hypothetical protein
MSCLRLVARSRAASIEVRADAQQRFNRWVQEKSSGSVWLKGGCASWYLDAEGVNRTLWPASTLSFWLRMRRVRPSDYILQPPGPQWHQATARRQATQASEGAAAA